MGIQPHFHFIDLAAVLCYLTVIITLGRRAAKRAKGEKGFFLADRKLGKFFQFFLNFGNATDANGAVGTASLVYQQGVSGMWLSFQTVFMNPYYWFMNAWFRRVRLVTTADLFADRFGGRELGRLYAFSQLVTAIISIGFSNFLTFKVVHSLFPIVQPLLFYPVYTSIVGVYVISGGMAAVALNEAFQGILIIVFSVMLIPFGFHEIGGWRRLHERVPGDFLSLFSQSDQSSFTGPAVVGILLVSLIQIHAVMGNMGISGSARNEFAARFGAAGGLYAKRLMIICWAFIGLLGVAIFRPGGLSDPDSILGLMSQRLLAPGLLGLMLVGILAANMSSLSNQAVAVSALVARNLGREIRSGSSGTRAVASGRVAMALVLAAGVLAALYMSNVASVLKTLILMNVPFGAAIFLIFFWRRVTATAVWSSVILSGIAMVIVPFAGPQIPALRRDPALLRTTVPKTAGESGVPLFFDALRARDPADPPGAPEGSVRFNFELFLLDRAGLDLSQYDAGQLLAAQFFFDGIFPFAVLVLASLVSRPTERDRVLQFYGKLKTPVGATPESDQAEIEETRRRPDRFDHSKLWPASSWEFTRWNRVDTLGFSICCAISALMVGLFWLLLHVLTIAAAPP